jgi:hypothetical protein
MVTILKNMTNIITAIGEIYIFRKGQNKKVWAALFLMVGSFLLDFHISKCIDLHEEFTSRTA